LLDALDAIEMISVCDRHFCKVLLVANSFIEHVQNSNDSIVESLFRKNVSAGAATEVGLSVGLRAKVEELHVKGSTLLSNC
jgi:hypothetical protein